MAARRWPVITLGLILINVVVFLCTYPAIWEQENSLWTVRAHILVLAARHPDLNLPPQAEQFVDDFQAHDRWTWAQLQNPGSRPIDDWDARMRLVDDDRQLQAQMDSLGPEYSTLLAASIAERYAFIPAHPRAIAYLTSMFLHGGWMHLIGNMWFLWLAGFVLEDVWGRPLYLAFYLLAGVAATQLHALMNSGSIGTSLGASGAIAGLMGAFLVRFPKLKIRMMWIFDLGLFAFWRPWVPAFYLLPLWLGLEIFYGAVFGSGDGVAHWAHVGGFTFGALAAVALRQSCLEHKANQAIEQKITWTSDPAMVQATELVDQGKLDEATVILKNYLLENPESIGAWNLLRGIHWKREEFPQCCEIAGKVCAINVRAGMLDAAWQDYQEYENLGGDKLHPAVWLEMCRLPESNQDYRRALQVYEKLAAAYPAKRQGLVAQIAAARILLVNLDRPDEALQRYQLAWESPVPHADLNREIDAGIKSATQAIRRNLSTAY